MIFVKSNNSSLTHVYAQKELNIGRRGITKTDYLSVLRINIEAIMLNLILILKLSVWINL